ncbi:MAG: NmrA/HSCARG family protein [Gemmatimonadota bacterium]
MSQKVIAVVGATGAQGGGLARAVLSDPEGRFALRALTRRPDSEAAQTLAEAGAEIRFADLDDPGSLAEAFRGAHGAFCLTNFWEHFSGAKETDQGRRLAEACHAAGVEHAIWSTFEDTRHFVPLDDDRMPTLQDAYKVAHFDAKAEADARFTALGVPTTFLLTSAYYENLITFGWGPQRGEGGDLVMVFPLGAAKMPMIAAEDIGRCALGIFRRADEYVGKEVGVAGDHLSGSEIAEALTRALGQTVTYVDVSPDAYRRFDFPGAEDVGNMFQFKRDFEEIYRGHRDLAESRRLNSDLQTFEEWLGRNASRIPIPD